MTSLAFDNFVYEKKIENRITLAKLEKRKVHIVCKAVFSHYIRYFL